MAAHALDGPVLVLRGKQRVFAAPLRLQIGLVEGCYGKDLMDKEGVVDGELRHEFLPYVEDCFGSRQGERGGDGIVVHQLEVLDPCCFCLTAEGQQELVKVVEAVCGCGRGRHEGCASAAMPRCWRSRCCC